MQGSGENLLPYPSPQVIIRIYYHPPSALLYLGWVGHWQPLILWVQQEGDYSSWGRRSGQVKAAEAPDIGEMGLGGRARALFHHTSQGFPYPMPWGALWMGWGRSCKGVGTGKLGVQLIVEYIVTQNRNEK